MPYIKQEDREQYDLAISEIVDALVTEATKNSMFKGNMNYIFTKIGKDFMAEMIANGHKFGYNQMDDVASAMRGAAVEWDRRVLAPYEDQKIEENGDV